MTECEHPELPLLATLDLKPIEHVLLSTLRTLCTGLEHDRLAHWMSAFNFAEERLGVIEGSEIVSGCISLLRALRAERSSGFGYMSRGCPHISEDEQNLISLIRAGRCTHNDQTELADAVHEVATDNSPYRLIAAARAISALCIRHESLQNFSAGCVQQHSTLLN